MKSFLVVVFFALVAILGAIGFQVAGTQAASDEVLRINLPSEAKQGSQFNLEVDIYNPSSYPIQFDGTVWHGGPGWSREDYPYTVWTGEVYWLHCQNGCRHFWRGTVQPGQNARFTIPTFAGNTLGTFEFAEATFIVTLPQGVYQAEKSLTVVDNRPVIRSVEPTVANPGNWVTINGENFLVQNTDVSSLAILLDGYGFLASVTPKWSTNQQISWGENSIRFRVPDNVPDKTGTISVIVNNKFGSWEGFRIQAATPTSTPTPIPTSTPKPKGKNKTR